MSKLIALIRRRIFAKLKINLGRSEEKSKPQINPVKRPGFLFLYIVLMIKNYITYINEQKSSNGFSPGDRVKWGSRYGFKRIGPGPRGFPSGSNEMGTVIQIRYSGEIAVEFDDFIDGHDSFADSRYLLDFSKDRGKYGYCWNCRPSDLIKVDEDEDEEKPVAIKWYNKGKFEE